MSTVKAAVAKFFTEQSGSVIYNHSKPMVVTVFKKYENWNCYRMEDHVTVLGLMNINIDGVDYGYNVPALIETNPSAVDEVDVNGQTMIAMTYQKGDIFIYRQEVIENNALAYAIFQMFIFEGLRYPWMTNDNVARAFDYISLCGFDVSTVPPVFYSIFTSELHRDDANPTVLARNTDLKGPIRYLGMKDVKLTASKLTTKLGGSYMKDTLKSALVHENHTSSELEDILRM